MYNFIPLPASAACAAIFACFTCWDLKYLVGIAFCPSILVNSPSNSVTCTGCKLLN